MPIVLGYWKNRQKTWESGWKWATGQTQNSGIGFINTFYCEQQTMVRNGGHVRTNERIITKPRHNRLEKIHGRLYNNKQQTQRHGLDKAIHHKKNILQITHSQWIYRNISLHDQSNGYLHNKNVKDLTDKRWNSPIIGARKGWRTSRKHIPTGNESRNTHKATHWNSGLLDNSRPSCYRIYLGIRTTGS